MNKELILRINKNLIKEDGSLVSFEKQLLQLENGNFDTRFPLVISENSKCLSYIDFQAIDKPLIITVSKVIKLREKHDLGYDFVSDCKDYLNNSIFAFDSEQHIDSKIIVLNEINEKGYPLIAVCKLNDSYGVNLELNEIKSIYDKKELGKMINRAYENDLNFYANKKIEINPPSIGLYLPKGIEFALSNFYDKAVFNKSQVENDLKAILKPTSIAEQIQKAKYKSKDRQQTSISKNIVKNKNKDKER